ncbi:MAG: lysylphosphatidylglycerol synthase transmembrane domain-containing protein [Chloroflexota bacterium]
MTKHLRLLLGLAFSAIAIYAVVRSVDPGLVAAALVGVNYLWMVPAIAVVMVAVWLRAKRWRLLFVDRASLRVSKLFAILMIGYLINTVFPARLGDPARAIIIGEIEGVKPARALGTVVVERLLDVLTVMVFLIAALPFIQIPTWMTQSAVLMATGATGGFAAVVILGRYRERVVPLIDRYARLLLKGRGAFVADQADHLLRGTDALANGRNAAAVVLLCLLIWVVSVVQTYTVMLAFALPVPVSAAVLLVVVNALGMVVPSSPGYVGVFHYLTVLTLGVYGIDPSLALSYAIVLHLVTFLPLSLFGLVFMGRESLSLGKVSARAAHLEG